MGGGEVGRRFPLTPSLFSHCSTRSVFATKDPHGFSYSLVGQSKGNVKTNIGPWQIPSAHLAFILVRISKRMSALRSPFCPTALDSTRVSDNIEFVLRAPRIRTREFARTKDHRKVTYIKIKKSFTLFVAAVHSSTSTIVIQRLKNLDTTH